MDPSEIFRKLKAQFILDYESLDRRDIPAVEEFRSKWKEFIVEYNPGIQPIYPYSSNEEVLAFSKATYMRIKVRNRREKGALSKL